MLQTRGDGGASQQVHLTSPKKDPNGSQSVRRRPRGVKVSLAVERDRAEKIDVAASLLSCQGKEKRPEDYGAAGISGERMTNMIENM